ncbi:MAG: transcriptional repressor [Lachnospiraceae bacterium]|nr:transcriptional repressor [Lachnospiraceae bacterium]
MAQYQTEQKRILLAYLKAHSEEAFTIEELCERLKSEPAVVSPPGKSTVYRIMPRLVEEGLVKRFVEGNSRKFLYQMVCGAHCDSHLHMKCSVCGKLYHMRDEESEALFMQVMKRHRFQIDEGKTVLFGQCEGCCRREEER